MVHHAELGEPASQDDLATARTYALYQLPGGIEELYSEMNGFSLAWEHHDGSEDSSQRGGAMALVPLARIFASWKDVTWWDDFEGGDRFRAVKPFDIFVSEACAAFWQEPGSPPASGVVFHAFGEGTCALNLSFPAYLDRLFEARGYLYWQLAFCPDRQEDPSVGTFRQRMPELFPDFDYDQFVSRER